MTQKEMQDFIASMRKKVGKETAGLIADDLGTLITDNANFNSTITNKESEIEKLKQDKENLIISNSNLLQQVGMLDDNSLSDKKQEDEVKEDFSFKSVFDEKGNFKK